MSEESLIIYTIKERIYLFILLSIEIIMAIIYINIKYDNFLVVFIINSIILLIYIIMLGEKYNKK